MSFTGRTSATIYEEIVNEIQNMPALSALQPDIDSQQTLLDDLTNESKVATWRLWAWVQAYTTFIMEGNMETFTNTVNDIKNDATVSSLAWYVDKAESFQYGDTLTISGANYAIGYQSVDETKQIIEQAAAVEIEGKLILKIKREDTDILSTDELNAFNSYINKIKIAGTRLQVWNYQADEMKLYMNIVYDPQTSLADVTSDVESAINDYIVNIPFNSIFIVSELIDEIQAVDGVKDPQFISGYGKQWNGTYSEFEHTYTALSGYAEIDSATPLSGTLTFEQKVN